MIKPITKEELAMEQVAANHRRQIQQSLMRQFDVPDVQKIPEIRLEAWLGHVMDVRLLCERWLNDIGHKNRFSDHLGDGVVGTFAKDGQSWLEKSGRYLVGFLPQSLSARIMNAIPMPTDVISMALGPMVTRIIHDSFCRSYHGRPDEAEQAFQKALEEQGKLTGLIQSECELISKKIMELFYFREMLLGLHKQTFDVKNDLMKRTGLKTTDKKTYEALIEVYFLKELNQLFVQGFSRLYQAHEQEIMDEKNSVILHWLNQYFDSKEQRQAFTQELQLEFMYLIRDFLLDKMQEPSVLAKKRILISAGIGFIAASLAVGILTPMLGLSAFPAIISLSIVAFILTGLTAWLTFRHVQRFQFSRKPDNRQQISRAVDMIHGDLLRLDKKIAQEMKQDENLVMRMRRFSKLSECDFLCLNTENIALGTPSAWLRDYAAHYRHSKERAIDLALIYQKLMTRSHEKNKEMIEKLKAGKQQPLIDLIKHTERFLQDSSYQDDISRFEIRQKFKEQMLYIVSHLPYTPPSLATFFVKPIDKGGLGGLTGALDEARRFGRGFKHINQVVESMHQYPTMGNINAPVLQGDKEYRQWLGVPTYEQDAITIDNIDEFLNNTHALLINYYYPLKAGEGALTMTRPMIPRDEFLVYRMLLLLQISHLCMGAFAHPDHEVVLKLKQFARECLLVEPDLLFDDLINMRLLEPVNHTTHLGSHIQAMLHMTMAYVEEPMTALKACCYIKRQYKELNHCILMDVNASDLKPKDSDAFLLLLKKSLNDTKAFLKAAKQPAQLIEYYRFEVSVFIYQLMQTMIASKLNKSELHKEALAVMIDFLQHAGLYPKENTDLNAFLKDCALYSLESKPLTGVLMMPQNIRADLSKEPEQTHRAAMTC